MSVLTSQQRNNLESAVKQARQLAEQGAFNALQAMAVNHPEPYKHMDAAQRKLRNTLRGKARLLGDKLKDNGTQPIEHLSYELAYETWHKMLFAKFLEVNNLLIHPSGVAVTMAECEELAREEGFTDKWDVAANYASRMLPAIFRVNDPLMQVSFSINDRLRLEAIIDGIDDNIFIADDALGWVYQFWQSEAKAAINASGDKIDGAKLPAVTQLFTEPYMVHFLIDNTLGAWWVSRNPQENSPVKFEYLRVAPTKVAPTKVAPTSSRSDSKNLRQDDGVTVTTSSNQSNTSEWWNYFNPFEEVEHIKGNLPHWRQEHKLYFVTFRTADSMPQEKLKAWQEERDAWKRHNPEPLSPEQKKEYYSRFPAKVQAYLDAGYGECLLAKPEIKRMMEEAIRHFDGQRYKLDEFVVAANHVHVLVEPLGENQLSEILHSWKSFTANEINKATGRQGTFWQKESFDHLVRSEASLEKFREYIRGHVSKVAPNSSRSNSESLRQDDGVTVAQASSRSNSESLRQDDGVTVAQASSRSDIDYLRQDGGATFGAAFEGWPEKTAEVTAMDPCMGSGHFLAALFPVFAKLRMHEEGLSKEEVADKVIAENLHGLELDPRCTQIAAFNLALAAWKFCGHYKALPEMNLACSGIAPKGKVEDWIKLVAKEKDPNTRYRMENGMRQLFNHFQLAPELGSLLDPTTIKADLETASFKELQPVLKKALEIEEDTDEVERGVIAAGIAKAGQLLSKKYTLQITNVPYLSRGKQDTAMADFIEKNYSEAKGDLATVFLQKMLKTNTTSGISCSVIPQNWLFLTSYKKFRERLLKNETWNVVTRLGTKGFQTPMWDFNVMLIAISHAKPSADHTFAGLDVSDAANAAEKDEKIKTAELKIVNQKEQLGNPDMVVSFESLEQESLLGKYANALAGIDTGDGNRFKFKFFELPNLPADWIVQLNSFEETKEFSGREHILYWQNGKGELLNVPGASIRNIKYWNIKGIYVVRMAKNPSTLSIGEAWDRNGAMLIPYKEEQLLPIWEYSKSEEFRENLRKLNQKLSISEATFPRINFDYEYWQKVATEKYPNGLPQPYSDDPTQWLFHGHPIKTGNPLQVAVVRLLGYRWPAEHDEEMELAAEARTLIAAVKAFDHLSDEDGIFCIPSVNAEQAGADRLRDYLYEVFKDEWNSHTITQLLQKEDTKKANLEAWLRDEFFVQHCKLFKNRPFIWHIWDGRKDGFSVLVNYHRLTKDNLSKLIYTYLGDWIRMCEAKIKADESGAEGLLSAALKLKEKLEAILAGEVPYDIFVRWKPIDQQPIGWDPDLNDGVRLNIRPFMEADVLRKKPNIKWGTDRGKNPPNKDKEKFPPQYFSEIRNNDKHISLEEKRKAREKLKTLPS